MEQPLASATAPTAAKRKSMPTIQCAEVYCFILSLSWNDVVVNGGKMSNKQQEELIKVKAWLECNRALLHLEIGVLF